MLGTDCLQRTLKSLKALPFKDPCIMIDVIVALPNTHPHSFVHGKKNVYNLKNKSVSEYAT